MDDSFDDILANAALDPADVNVIASSSSGQTINKPKPRSSNSVLVNSKQRGNPLLKSITNVPWEYADIIPDYEIGPNVCALFLSVKYHNLNPDYIHNRLKNLRKMYQLRVLLVLVDISDPHVVLKHLTRLCILADLTLMLAWNSEEAGRIIETYKIYEHKPADRIMEKSESSPHQRIIQALTSIKSINKTDAMNLIAKYGTLENLVKATENELCESIGLGPKKASKLYGTLHKNFCKSGKN